MPPGPPQSNPEWFSRELMSTYAAETYKRNQSGYKGIYKDPRDNGKWRVGATIGKKKACLGAFADFNEAIGPLRACFFIAAE